jgi:hypothetical protein
MTTTSHVPTALPTTAATAVATAAATAGNRRAVRTAGAVRTADAVKTAGAGRIRVLAVALAASALTILAILVNPPWGDRIDTSKDDFLKYDDLQAVRDAAWAGLLVDGFAFAVLGLTVGLATLHLVRTRGRITAMVGSVLTTAGGIAFAMGSLGFATFTWFATSSGLSEDAGRSLVAYGNDHIGRVIGAVFAGFVLYTLGTLFLATALLRARTVPVPAVVAYLLLVVAQFLPFVPATRGVDLVQIAMMALLTAYAVVVWRRAAG